MQLFMTVRVSIVVNLQLQICLIVKTSFFGTDATQIRRGERNTL